MSREKEFFEDYKGYLKQERVGRDEVKTFYLHEIALHLAIIADCLEDRKERKKDERYSEGHGPSGEM